MFDYSTQQGLYSAAQTRALDRHAIEKGGIAGGILMARAAAAAWELLLQRWPEPRRIQVVCGTGNNGGDGYLLADIAHKRGFPVTVWQVGDAGRIAGDALRAREQALANGVVVAPFARDCLAAEGVLVDALLGTGLGGEVRPAQYEAIVAMNAAGLPLLALDIPSGLCADSGRVLGAAVKADATATFIVAKRGLYTGAGPACCGDIHLATIGVPRASLAANPAAVQRLDLYSLLAQWPARKPDAHKGDCGRVVVVGGDDGMGGAILLAAEAALRCGAGLVSAATRERHVSALLARCPEAMARGVRGGQDLAPMLAAVDAIALGPGLGQSSWSEQLFQAACDQAACDQAACEAQDKTLVVDADGLNLLAGGAGGVRFPRQDWVLTPHPGEAARLLGTDTAAIQADRFAAVQALQARYGGVVVLKGKGSLICDGRHLLLSDYGNPGMASGGMGDVLSGVIAALLAQGLAPLDAAALGVCLHGAAADSAAGAGQRGLLASDLLAPMRELLG
ncbi:NAD(P)H-hydrate dehydratase [Parahaliea aestuarii]|uniref:Bifunctional NAD(P)H-hydrate repair enzyme n=1 Tax=Parahaliea aestuarii TaxID=1852021 RepID=A0A5C8ZN04_9GAMM|nr:NAD(P)H-hydrate dehydratase [Parahaliea aestuarii]TXS89142.1 NAD(P)H-hydrate dehydratase [Parahaliea aestuarii]